MPGSALQQNHPGLDRTNLPPFFIAADLHTFKTHASVDVRDSSLRADEGAVEQWALGGFKVGSVRDCVGLIEGIHQKWILQFIAAVPLRGQRTKLGEFG